MYCICFSLRLRMEQVKGRCVTDPEFESVNNTFERALVFMHKMPRIWIDYCRFLMNQRKITRTRKVGHYAVDLDLPMKEKCAFKNPGHNVLNDKIMVIFILAIIYFPLSNMNICFQTFDRALCALPITQHNRIWPLYLKFVMLYNIPETAVRVWRRYLKVSYMDLCILTPHNFFFFFHFFIFWCYTYTHVIQVATR